MGRKQRFFSLFCGFLLFFSLTLLFQKCALASDDLRVYVHVLPEKPNAADGWFWQNADVRIKLELFNVNENPLSVREDMNVNRPIQAPIKVIDWDKSSLKIKYSWDNLDTERAVDYKSSFQPIEGEHWVFAWALNQDGSYATPATKFYMQFSLIPRVTPTLYRQQVSVSQDYLSWGVDGQPKKTGQITEEAASTSKVISPTPAPAPQTSLQSKLLKLLTGQKNIWILLLVVGLVLLVIVKLLFRGGNREKGDIISNNKTRKQENSK